MRTRRRKIVVLLAVALLALGLTPLALGMQIVSGTTPARPPNSSEQLEARWDAILDGALSDTTPGTPGLSWDSSLNPSNASQVVLDSKNRMMYAAAADQQAVYQIDVQSKMVVGMAKTEAAPLTMAVVKSTTRVRPLSRVYKGLPR